MEMSDKEFKQRMILSLSQNEMLHDIAKIAQVKKVSMPEMLVNISTETCERLNESCDKPNQ